nr:MAG TPA: hypothetical protein [Bacteriophage sp.]
MSNLPGSRTDEHTDVTAIMMDRHEMAKHTSKGAVPYILLSAVVQGLLYPWTTKKLICPNWASRHKAVQAHFAPWVANYITPDNLTPNNAGSTRINMIVR